MKLSAFLLLAFACFAQTRQTLIQDRFENLDFAAGPLGAMPPGWQLGPEGTTIYSAQALDSARCNGGHQCGSVRSVDSGVRNMSFLYQCVDAAPYRNKVFTYRAAVRADLSAGSVARLLVRIHRHDGSTGYRWDMGDHPITSGPWAVYKITAPIAADARDIEFGMQLFGEGSASIDNISLTFGIPQGAPDEDNVRWLIRKFADSRNRHDGAGVVALFSEQGEWIGPEGDTARGPQALAALWGTIVGAVTRTIESVDFLGGNVAQVRVTAQWPALVGRHHEYFIVAEENGAWSIRAHRIQD